MEKPEMLEVNDWDMPVDTDESQFDDEWEGAIDAPEAFKGLIDTLPVISVNGCEELIWKELR